MNKYRIIVIVLFLCLRIGDSIANSLDSLSSEKIDSLRSSIRNDFDEIEKQLVLNDSNLSEGNPDSNVFVFHASTSIVETNNETYLFWSNRMKHYVVKSSYGVDNSNDEQAINDVLGKLHQETNRKLVLYITSIATYPDVKVYNTDGKLNDRYTGNPGYRNSNVPPIYKYLSVVQSEVEKIMYGSLSPNKEYTTIVVIRIAQFVYTVTKTQGKVTWQFDTDANLAEKFSLKHAIRILPAKYISQPCIAAIMTGFSREVKSDLQTFVSNVSKQFRSLTCNPEVDCSAKATAFKNGIKNKNEDEIVAAVNSLLVPEGQVINGKGGIVKYGDAGVSYDLFRKTLTNCLSVDERVSAVETLADLNWTSAPYEKVIIDLVENIKKEDINLFFDKIRSSGIYYKMYSSVDGENSERMLAALTNLFYGSKFYISSTPTDLTHKNTYVFNGYDWYKGNNYIFNVEGNNYRVVINLAGDKLDEYLLDAFSTVELISRVPPPYIKADNIGNKFFSVKVPAFYLKMLLDKAARKSTGQLAEVTVIIAANAFTFGVGGTMLSSELMLVRCLGGLDMVAATIGTSMIAVKPIFEGKYGVNSNQYKVAENIELISNIYNFGRLATDIILLPKLIDDGGKLWQLERNKIKNDGTLTEAQVNSLDDLYKVSGKLVSFLDRLDNLGLVALKKRIALLDETTKLKFCDDFEKASDYALNRLELHLNDNIDLVQYWNKNRNLHLHTNAYPADMSHIDWPGNPQFTGSDLKIYEELNTIQKNEIKAAGYCEDLGDDIIVKSNLVDNMETNDVKYFAYVKSLEEPLQEYCLYLDIIRKDLTDGSGKLYTVLLNGVTDTKLTYAQRPGVHAEAQVLNEILKKLRLDKGLEYTRSSFSKIKIIVRGEKYGAMCRCPNCYQITQGVNMLFNK